MCVVSAGTRARVLGAEREHAAHAAQNAFGFDFADEEPEGWEVDGDKAEAGFENSEVDGFGVDHCDSVGLCNYDVEEGDQGGRELVPRVSVVNRRSPVVAGRDVSRVMDAEKSDKGSVNRKYHG